VNDAGIVYHGLSGLRGTPRLSKVKSVNSGGSPFGPLSSTWQSAQRLFSLNI
jgi:hypothetical protein